MAKKARRKLEEEEASAFEFPPFDEQAYATKEFELGTGLAIAGGIAVGLGVLGWVLTVLGMPAYVPFALALTLIIASPFLIRRMRTLSNLYTTGDWASLVMLEFFGFLALWFLLLNLSPTAI